MKVPEYSSGIAMDGAVIMKNGKKMDIEQIVAELQAHSTSTAILEQLEKWLKTTPYFSFLRIEKHQVEKDKWISADVNAAGGFWQGTGSNMRSALLDLMEKANK